MVEQVHTTVADYYAISKKVAEFCERHPTGYNECVDALRRIMRDYFPALYLDTNPVVANLERWAAEDIAFLIVEYSGWLNETIHMFLDARIRIYWDGVRKEIDRNVGEEMGVLTRGVPHLELMRQGYRKDLGIETDDVSYSAITRDFVSRMRDIFKHKDNAFSSGALLAFESAATEEFKVVNAFLRRRKSLMGSEIVKGSLTDIYIAGHVIHEGEGIHPEDTHYEGLRYAVEPYIGPENIHRFVQGYFAVSLNINIWWERLITEVYHHRMLRNNLTVRDVETFDLAQMFEAQSA